MALTKITGKGIGAVDEITSDTAGTSNFVAGVNAGDAITSGGNYNVCVGDEAGTAITTGDSNTAVGYQAGNSNITSDRNTFIGEGAGYSATSERNSFVGHQSGYYVSTGAKNTILGRFDGNQGNLDIRTSSNNIVLSDGDGNPKFQMDYHARSIIQATYTTGYGLKINNSASSGVVEGIEINTLNVATDSSGGHYLKCNDSVTTRCVIDLNGNLRNHDNSYGAISDQRAKQDIVDAASQWDDIKAIQVRKYKKIDDVTAYGDASPVEIGVIAQELEASGMGGLVDTPENPDEMKSVKYSILYMKAVKALQEAMTRIETLEAKVTALEGE